jgi:uridine monophosphate synthetase
MTKEQFVLYLYKIGAIKFGEFKLKSGITSPFYIDLRLTVSYPELMDGMAKMIIEKIEGKKFDLVTGIPYTALPVASIVSSYLKVPLIFVRKEEKAYGTKRLIEGVYKENDTVLIIDDVVTTGESKIEVANVFRNANLNVKDIVVLVDRSYNAKEFLSRHSLTLLSIISMDEVLSILRKNNLIEDRLIDEVKAFIKRSMEEERRPTLKERMLKIKNPVTRKLIELMEAKSTNLCLSLDKETSKEFFEVLDKTSDKIAVLKTHIDVISDFSLDFVAKLKERSEKDGFIILEDRKFADIGNTVRKQYQGGIYRIAMWSHLVTVHTIAGPSILDGLFGNLSEERGAVLLAKMSSKDNLITDDYTRRTIEIGERYQERVSGFVGFGENKDEIKELRRKIRDDFLLFMPGVSLTSKSDSLGQRYVTPAEAVRGGADIIIVGRGIYGDDKPGTMAEEFRREAWEAKLKNEI